MSEFYCKCPSNLNYLILRTYLYELENLLLSS